MNFNRISILQLSGLFTKYQSEEDGKYYESRNLKIKAFFIYFMAITATLRLSICELLDQNDPRQLFIGNIFNQLNLKSRQFFAIGGIAIISWLTTLFINFRNINNNQSELIIFWLKMIEIIPIDDQFKLVGISRKENRFYWNKQNKFYKLFLRFCNIYIIFLIISLFLPLYFTRYDANVWIFILNFIVLSINYLFLFFHLVKAFLIHSFFFFEIILFFCFKFDKLIEKLNKINLNKTKSLNYNLKLTKLVYQFDHIYLETVKFNSLFNEFIGLNYLHFFLFGIIFLFAGLFGDINLKIGFPIIITFMYLFVIYLPYYLSSKLTHKMQKVIFILQNATFKSIINHSNKRKIDHVNYIAKFNDGYVFQSLNLFPMNSNYAFNTGIQIIMNILLLIRVSQILY